MTIKNIRKLAYIPFVAMLIIGVVYFTSKFKYFADLERSLIPIRFIGRIDSMRNLNRGSYYVKIVTKDSVIELQSLPIAYDVNRTNLRIGDSVAKERQSEKIFFFRRDLGKRLELFEYQISQ